MRIPACLIAAWLVAGTAFAADSGPQTNAPEATPVVVTASVAIPNPAPVASPVSATPQAPKVEVAKPEIAKLDPTKPEAVKAQPRGVSEAPLDYRGVDALLRHDEYPYRAGGRDPFAPLVTSEKGEADEEGVITDPGVADLIMVGRAWGGGTVYALAETPQGMGLLLRVGDRVRDGRVVAILPEGVTFSQTTYGVTRQVTLPFGSVEEGRDER